MQLGSSQYGSFHLHPFQILKIYIGMGNCQYYLLFWMVQVKFKIQLLNLFDDVLLFLLVNQVNQVNHHLTCKYHLSILSFMILYLLTLILPLLHPYFYLYQALFSTFKSLLHLEATLYTRKLLLGKWHTFWGIYEIWYLLDTLWRICSRIGMQLP